MRFAHHLHFRMISTPENERKKAKFSDLVSAPHPESFLRVLKCSRKASRQEKKSKKGPKTDPSWPAKSVARGWTNASRGHFFTFRWSDVLSGCNFTHFYLFSDLRNAHMLLKICLVSAIYCSLCTSAPDVKTKKNARVPPCISWLRLASQMLAERVSVLYFRL